MEIPVVIFSNWKKHVCVEKDEKSDYAPGSEFTRDARSRLHVEELMPQILATERTSSTKITLGCTDQENGETDDRWH
jgi:hypothetical protein